jgi:outer membrane biogenesis lipoprotein LolB
MRIILITLALACILLPVCALTTDVKPTDVKPTDEKA